MKQTIPRSAHEAGFSLVAVTFLVAAAAVLSLTLMRTVASATKERGGSRRSLDSLYVSEAGLSAAVFDLASGGDGILGSEGEPVSMGSSSYWVEATDMGDGRIALVSTAMENDTGSRVEVVVEEVVGEGYDWAAFGDEGLAMDSNAHVDSYHSRKGDYKSQQVNGTGSDAWANDAGDVGSNSDIVLKQNSVVNGDSASGPTSTTTVTGNAVVTGATTPSADLEALDPIVMPSYGSYGDFSASGTVSIPSGTHEFEDFRVETGATVYVQGPATLVFDSLELRSNSQIVVDATDGAVEFYVEHDFILGSNTLIASKRQYPEDVKIMLESDNIIDPDSRVDLDEIDFKSNSRLYGVIYAPNAFVEIQSNFELFGALVARRVLLDSWSRVHYDEALRSVGSDGRRTFQTLCWRELALPTASGTNSAYERPTQDPGTSPDGGAQTSGTAGDPTAGTTTDTQTLDPSVN